MQAETVDRRGAGGSGSNAGQATAYEYLEARADSASLDDDRALKAHEPGILLWRMVPGLVLLAVWLPRFMGTLPVAGRASDSPIFWMGRLAPALDQRFGEAGVVMVAAIATGLMALGIWMLARGLYAPRWFAALLSSVLIIAPLLGLAPWPVEQLDDAAFAALMALAAAQTVWSARTEKGWPLFLGFLCATLAGLFRPGAVWMALLVGIAILVASRSMEERPWCGMFASLCWVPGLEGTSRLFEFNLNVDKAFFSPAVSSSVPQGLIQGGQHLISGLLTTLPLLLLFAAAGLSGLIGWSLKGNMRQATLAVIVCVAIALCGAIGYGNIIAARYLLDPLLLGACGSLGLLLPKLWQSMQKPSALGQSEA